MNAKHTPGPWRVGGTKSRVIFAANGDVVARTAAYGEQSETPDAEKGNAALIAAAPDLLAALQESETFCAAILSTIPLEDTSTRNRLAAQRKVIRAAITKAAGEQA